MQKKTKFHFIATSLLTVAVLLSACAKQSANRAGLKHDNDILNAEDLQGEEIIEMLPTLSDEKLAATGYEYEPTPKTIQTPQVTLRLEKIRMKKVVLTYDVAKRKFSVKGLAIVLDDQKKEIADSPFSLAAIHEPNQESFSLIDTENLKMNSSDKPVVRAKVTCLPGTEDDTVDCSQAIVDFFIAYKKNVYTEQMETKPKTVGKPAAPTKAAKPAPTAPSTATPSANDNDHTSGTVTADTDAPANTTAASDDSPTQVEAEDDSVLGRYQGQAQTTDLSKEFDADDDIQSVLKPVVVTPPKKTEPAPAKPPVPTPTAPTAPAPTPVKPVPTPVKPPVVTPTHPAPAPAKPPVATPVPVKPAPTVPVTPAPTTSTQTVPAPVKPAPTVPAPVTPAPVVTAPTVPVTTSDKAIDVTNVKEISSVTAQLIDGTVRFIDQAIGYTDSGKLRNATSVLDKQKALSSKAYFEVTSPTRMMYFATYEMAEMIVRLGRQLNETFHKKLAVSDISRIKGGYSSPHASHQIGMDADLGYPSTDATKFPRVATSAGLNTRVYSAAKTFDLFKFAFQQKDIEVARIFVDQRIIKDLCSYAKSAGELTGSSKGIAKVVFDNIQHVDGHGDHFHLRLKCGTAQKTCRDRVYRVMKQCG